MTGKGIDCHAVQLRQSECWFASGFIGVEQSIAFVLNRWKEQRRSGI
ncbi:MAG: hypothetical protein U9Q81_21015 [Pseudomonadota bacterium]|nr:hypothetical protein [Pseudomonadota bacterium]